MSMEDCVMIGHPSCPRRFAEAVRMIGDAPFCIAVPPVTPELEPVFSGLLEKAALREDAELSLNDWGTLHRCAEMKRKGMLRAFLTAGVLLAGQDTDPLLRTLRSAETPDAFISHTRTPSIFALVPLLREKGVTRLTLCAQPYPLPEEGPGLPVTLISEAIVSVFPCGHDCAACDSPPFMRGGVLLSRRENLLIADMPMETRVWIDRKASL